MRAICDINPAHLQKADEVMAKAGVPKATHYEEWKTMIEKEDLEAVVLAVPLWLHADMTVGMLQAGKHVLCEKMMAWDGDGCRRMIEAAQKSGKLLEIGYQRFYNPVYQAAYEGVIKSGTLGDVFHARLVWHRNGPWRRKEEPPAPGYDPSRWGYPTFDHLINWRLFWKYSQGLSAELASHQVNIANWFFGATPETVLGSGGVYRWTNEGREVPDHVYLTFEYPHGRTAVFTSIESNAYDHYYEAYFGTKATLILRGETEAYLFDEGGEKQGHPDRGHVGQGQGAGDRRLGEPDRRRRRALGGDERAAGRCRPPAVLPQRDLRVLRRRPHRHAPALRARRRPSARPSPASPGTRPWRRRPGWPSADP